MNPPISTRQATIAALSRLQSQLLEYEPLIASPDAPDALHDYRIALRKTRALLGRMEPVLAPAERVRYSKAFAALMLRTGPLRDLQVCITLLSPGNVDTGTSVGLTFDTLHKYIRRRQRSAEASLQRYLGSPTHRRLMQDWSACISSRPEPAGNRARANVPLASSLHHALAGLWQEVCDQADKAARRGSVASLHKLRKLIKDLRYLFEMYADQFDREDGAEMCARLKHMQGLLGRMQDTHILYEQLGEVVLAPGPRLDDQQRKQVLHWRRHLKAGRRTQRAEAARQAKKLPKQNAALMRSLLD